LESVQERASGVLEVAEEHDYQIWRALALVLQGAALTGLRRSEEGLALGARTWPIDHAAHGVHRGFSSSTNCG
jgi:hypothetical protein